MSSWLMVLELQVDGWDRKGIVVRPLLGVLDGDGECVVEDSKY